MKTQYIFSIGEIKRKDNSIAFKNEKGWKYIPIEQVRELYFMNEESLIPIPKINQTFILEKTRKR